MTIQHAQGMAVPTADDDATYQRRLFEAAVIMIVAGVLIVAAALLIGYLASHGIDHQPLTGHPLVADKSIKGQY